jgi:hypothetical protein
MRTLYHLGFQWSLIQLVTNLHDTTDNSFRAYATPVPPREASEVLTFPAYWSATNTVELQLPLLGGGTNPKGCVSRPEGPASPSYQPLGADPVATIFCDARWEYDGSGRSPKPNCDKLRDSEPKPGSC